MVRVETRQQASRHRRERPKVQYRHMKTSHRHPALGTYTHENEALVSDEQLETPLVVVS